MSSGCGANGKGGGGFQPGNTCGSSSRDALSSSTPDIVSGYDNDELAEVSADPKKREELIRDIEDENPGKSSELIKRVDEYRREKSSIYRSELSEIKDESESLIESGELKIPSSLKKRQYESEDDAIESIEEHMEKSGKPIMSFLEKGDAVYERFDDVSASYNILNSPVMRIEDTDFENMLSRNQDLIVKRMASEIMKDGAGASAQNLQSLGNVNVFGESHELKTNVKKPSEYARSVNASNPYKIELSTDGLAGGDTFGGIEFLVNSESKDARVVYLNSSQALKGQGVGNRMYAGAMKVAKDEGAERFSSDNKVSHSAFQSWESLASKLPDGAVTRSPDFETGPNQVTSSGPLFSVDLSKVSDDMLESIASGSMNSGVKKSFSGWPESLRKSVCGCTVDTNKSLSAAKAELSSLSGWLAGSLTTQKSVRVRSVFERVLDRIDAIESAIEKNRR